MEISKIIDLVKEQINNSRAGKKSEHPKFDFKYKWYDLSSKSKPYYEFLKDSTAIANTLGYDGFLVIGYDDKRDLLKNSPMLDSGLNDSLKILELLNKNIVEPFQVTFHEIEFEGVILSVIHIPPSISKPHLIKEYRRFKKDGTEIIELNKVFVRKDTGTYPANKYDIDLMYYDRKNVKPEYQVVIDTIQCNISIHRLRALEGPSRQSRLSIEFTIENIGLRPISIKEFTIMVENNKRVPFSLIGKFTMHGIKPVSPRELLLKPGEMQYFEKLVFVTNIIYEKSNLDLQINDQTKLDAILRLTNNRDLVVKINRNDN